MKMNKMFKVLVAGTMLVLAVGCEEAKEVENINIQDTNPIYADCEDYNLIANKLNTDVEFFARTMCQYFQRVGLDKTNLVENAEAVQIYNDTFDTDYEADEFVALVKRDLTIVAHAGAHAKECDNCGDINDNMVLADECQELLEKGLNEFDKKVEAVQKGLEAWNNDTRTHEEIIQDAIDDYIEEHPEEVPCDNCGGLCDPYYSEDGITVCGEWCLQEMQNKIANEGIPYEAVCGYCGHHVRDVLYNENLGMEVCEDCWQ